MKINYIKLCLLNYVYILMLELTFKLAIIKTIDLGILYILIFSLPVAIFLTFIGSLFKRRMINKIISILMWFILFLVFAAETVYYSFYKTICGLSALMYGGQVMEFFSSILEHITFNIPYLVSMFIPLLILIILSLTNVIKHEKYILKDSLALLVACLFMALTSLEYKTKDIDAAKTLFYSTNNLMQSTNKFGNITSISLDAIKTLTGFEENLEIVDKLPFTKEEETEYNITNIDFQTLIDNESNETIKSMHTYFSNQVPTKQNEYTGIFAGKNLIFIVAEAFYPIAVHEELTPTLYKLVNNGFIFKNFYQPIYNCSTSDGEFITSLSILPGVTTCSMDATLDTYLPYALGNILTDYEYKANAFHGWTYSYYNRHKTMPNLGYTYYGYDRYKKGYKYALKGIKNQWPTSDIDVINASYNIYNQEERFVSYYMSISGHLEYNFTGGNAISLKNKKLVKDMDASTKIKAYMATHIEFDKSLEILLNNLENDGILDDTVIVIVPDHYPYGLSNQDISEYVDWMQDPNFDLYKNNLVIYNSEMENVVVENYTSGLDILPILLNLFGVKYDSRLLIGHDIFSGDDDLVIFNNKSWITKLGRYDYLKKKFEEFTDTEVSQEYINEINEIVDMKFRMSKLLISKNYYKKVFAGGE